MHGHVNTYLLEVIRHYNCVHTAGTEVRQEEAHQNRLPATKHTNNVRNCSIGLTQIHCTADRANELLVAGPPYFCIVNLNT